MKTHRIRLDRERELRFPSKAIRDLEIELGERHGKGLTYFIQQIGTEQLKTGTADFRFDVLVSAIKYGLRHDERLSDDQVCDLIDESPGAEIDLWSAVTSAYLDARGMRIASAEDEEEEMPNDPPEPSRLPATA